MSIVAEKPVITDEQVDFYNEKGYVVVDELFNPEEVRQMVQALDQLVDKARGLTDHDEVYDLEPSHTADNPRVRRIKLPFNVHPIYRQMAEHPKLLAVLSKLIGPNCRLHGGKINLKSAEYGSPVEWHQDWAFYPHTNDDVLAIGVMLDDMTEENGPLMIVPGSHKGPTYDHHQDGYFYGAMDPTTCKLDYENAEMATGKAGSCSFHHVRAVHGSAQNTSGRDRRLLLYQVAAADAFDLRGLETNWQDHVDAMILGEPTVVPRFVDTPVRMPYPGALKGGSIYENQSVAKNRYFDFDKKVDAAE